MDMVTRVQILDEVAYISQSANSLRKGMNPTILPPAMGKIIGKTGLFNFGMETSLGEWNLCSNLLSST